MAEGEATTTAAAADIPVDLTGKWRLDRNENFDEFMKAAGFGLIKRKIANSVTTIIEIQLDGDQFTFSTKTPVGPRVTSFRVGVEYPESNPMWGDKEHRVMPEWQGNKLVQRVILDPGDEEPKSFEREIVNGEFVVTMNRGAVVCKRYFKKG